MNSTIDNELLRPVLILDKVSDNLRIASSKLPLVYLSEESRWFVYMSINRIYVKTFVVAMSPGPGEMIQDKEDLSIHSVKNYRARLDIILQNLATLKRRDLRSREMNVLHMILEEAESLSKLVTSCPANLSVS